MLHTPNFHLPNAAEFRVVETYYSPVNALQPMPQSSEPAEPGSKEDDKPVITAAERLSANSRSPLRQVIGNTVKGIRLGSRSPIPTRKSVSGLSPLLIRSRLYTDLSASSQTQRFDRSSRHISHRTARRVTLSQKQQTLHDLVRNNDFSSLKKIMHTISPEDVNSTDANGNPPLYYASQSSLPMTSLLLHLGARVNFHCENRNTPLHAAFTADREDIILFLLRNGADLQKKNRDKLDPIASASDRIRGNLGITTEDDKTIFTARDLIVKLKPKRLYVKPKPANEGRKATIIDTEKTQILRSVTEGRIRLRERKIRRHSPLYPSPMRSGVRFQGECLSPEMVSPQPEL